MTPEQQFKVIRQGKDKAKCWIVILLMWNFGYAIFSGVAWSQGERIVAYIFGGIGLLAAGFGVLMTRHWFIFSELEKELRELERQKS